MKALRILVIVIGILSIGLSAMMVIQSEKMRTARVAAAASSGTQKSNGCAHSGSGSCCNH